jgi:hypothetical protein
VDHEVKDNAAVLNPPREGAQAVDFEEADILRDLFDSPEAGIVALDVTHLEGAFLFSRDFDQFVCLFKAERDWFLYQRVDSPCEEFPGYCGVRGGGGGNTHCVDSVKQALVILEKGNPERLGPLFFGGVGITNPYEFHLGERGQNPGMFLPDVANSHDPDSNFLSH